MTGNGLIPPKDGSSPSAAHLAAIEAIGSTRGFIDARPAPAFGNVKTSTIGRDVRPPRLLCLVPVAGGTAVRKNPADLSAPVSNRKSGTTHLPHDRADPALAPAPAYPRMRRGHRGGAVPVTTGWPGPQRRPNGAGLPGRRGGERTDHVHASLDSKAPIHLATPWAGYEGPAVWLHLTDEDRS